MKTYTTRDACRHLFKDRVHDIVREKTDAQSGGQEWLKYYAPALAAVYNDLNEEELEECSELAEKWNEEGPSAEKQQKLVLSVCFVQIVHPCSVCSNLNRYLGSTVKKFVNDLQKTMGVQLLVIVGNVKPDGKIHRQKYDFQSWTSFL
jgi:hypothetical protein